MALEVVNGEGTLGVVEASGRGSLNALKAGMKTGVRAGMLWVRRLHAHMAPLYGSLECLLELLTTRGSWH